MRVLIVSSIYLPMAGGLPLFAHRLAFYLQQHGHEVLVLAPSETMKSEMRVLDGVNIMGMASVKSYLYKNYRLTLAPGLYRNIEKTILHFKPDVIHIQGHFAIERRAVKIAKKHHIPVVGTNHTAFESIAESMPFRHVKPWVALVKKLFWQRIFDTFKDVTIATAPSLAAKKMLEQHGLTIPMQTISNGLDTQVFNPNQKNTRTEKKYGLPNKPILLSVSRLDKEKEMSFALAGVALAIKKMIAMGKKPFHFVVAGEGNELQNLKKQAARDDVAPYVSFLGPIKNRLGKESDLPAIYACADGFITASPMEFQGIAVMEAMASGLPILAANRRALPELVDDEKNGFLFELDRPEVLGDKIIKIMEDAPLRKKMATASLEKIKPHDIQSVVSQFENIYKKAIAIKKIEK